MSLTARIREDWIAARKARQEISANLLGVLVGNIQNKSKTFNPERELTEDEVLKEIQKLLNGVVESKKLVTENSQNFAKLQQEETILSVYVPTKLTTDELTSVIEAAVKTGKDLKTIMSELKASYPGQYDGKQAADIIKSYLAK